MQTKVVADNRATAESTYHRFRLLKFEQFYCYMTGAYVYKSFTSSAPCIFDPTHQSNYLRGESKRNLPTIPRVFTIYT